MEDQKPFDVRAKLASELGRVPPETKSSPDDYAPKRDRVTMTEGAPELAQRIKTAMRDLVGWHRLSAGEREALDLIATEISRICDGRNFWKELGEWATLGQEGNLHG